MCAPFRLAFWGAAAQQAGIPNSFETADHPRDGFKTISRHERYALIRTLVAGLRELPSVWCNTKAFRLIIYDLEPPLFLHGVLMALDTELAATPAGEALAGIRAYYERVRARRLQREA